MWTKELEDDPDRGFLLDGIVNGFQLIPADATLQPAEMNNYKSATDSTVRDQVEQTLLEEIREGNYVVTDTKLLLSVLWGLSRSLILIRCA